MKLCLERVSSDWLHTWNHDVLVAESFVDAQLFRGTCSKARGWSLLGHTQGLQRARQDYYVAHDRPKELWVRELRPGARTILRGHHWPAALKAQEAGQVPACPQSAEELGQRLRFFGSTRPARPGSTGVGPEQLIGSQSVGDFFNVME